MHHRFHTHILLVLQVLAFSGTISCQKWDLGKSDRARKPPAIPVAYHQSLVFSAFDPMAMPWHSTIYRVSLLDDATAAGEQPWQIRPLHKLLEGESSDPYLTTTRSPLGGQTWFFNRALESQNVRTIDAARGEVGQQIGLPGLRGGDPHDVLDLGHDRLLLANFVKGTLEVLDTVSGSIVQTLEGEWDVPERSHFQPDSFVDVALPGAPDSVERVIYVIHQGTRVTGFQIDVDGSQAAFVLHVDSDGVVTAVDQDLEKPKIQGIPLLGVSPTLIRGSGARPRLATICHTLYRNRAACRSLIEEIDPVSGKSSEIWELPPDLALNGFNVTEFGNGVFFASVEKLAPGQSKGTRHVAAFRPDRQEIDFVYDYASGSGGFWLLLHDSTAQRLYVGDDEGGKTPGRLHRIDLRSPDSRKTLALDEVPYSGTLVAP